MTNVFVSVFSRKESFGKSVIFSSSRELQICQNSLIFFSSPCLCASVVNE